jgi:hypothetical protein
LSVRLSEDKSREVLNFVQGVSKQIRFDGVLVADCQSGQKVFLQGPVDLNMWCLFDQTGLKPPRGRGGRSRSG